MIHNISRFIAALALLATAQGAWAQSTETLGKYTFTVGTDDEGSYYAVDCEEALIGLSIYMEYDRASGKRFKQTADITMTGATFNNRYFAPIGKGDNTYFSGTYDGGSHTISGLNVSHDTYAGLFGRVQGANLHDIVLVSPTVAATETDAGTYVGPIVAFTKEKSTQVSNCTVINPTVTLPDGFTGNAGAIVGKIYDGRFSNCHFYGGNQSDAIGFNFGNTVTNVSRVYTLTATGCTATATATVTVGTTSYYNSGTAVSLGHADPPAGYLFSGYSSDDVTITDGAFTMPAADVAVAATFTPDPAHFSQSGDEYTIHTATGWNVFCDALQDNDTYNRFGGKTVRLGANIGTAESPVTRMAGGSGHEFTGTFDGGGHTLTVNYANTDNNTMTAPFSYVNGATIQNLIVGGTISGTAYRAAGIVGETPGQTTITNCVSSVDISSGRYTGGISIGGLVTITGCVFNGKIVGSTLSGGFVGYSNTATAISNSLFAPQDGSSISGGTFYYNGGGDITPTNSYYTSALGTPQGKATRTVAAAADVTIGAVALTGTPTQYTVSGITAYSGGGLQRGETLYYGSDDQLSLTLSNSATGAPQGYQYGYTASAGTLSGTTLTMPDQDVTISVNTADLAPIDWATVNQGTDTDPYMIYNKDQLLLLAHRVNGTNGETANTYQGMYFKLGADITFSHDAEEGDDYAENYESIGGFYNGDDRCFNGRFDGDGHTVSGIRIRKTGSGYADENQGLFGITAFGADIQDVHLTDARITGYDCVGGIVGIHYEGYIRRCTVTDSHITATGNSNYGTICGSNSTTNTDRFGNNYYHGCTVNGTAVTSGVGCQEADIAANNGALPAYRLDLDANITTPPGTFVGQTEWLDTPPVDPRLAPENGYTLAGNHYFASGYVFTPGSTLASGAAQGYTPRATLGDQLLDLYTHTGDAPDYTGTAIAQFTVTADCDGKTLSAALRSDGQQHEVSYMTADGTAQTAQAVALDGTETTLAAGTYFAGLPTVQFDHTLTLTGNVTLILADNCHMNVGTSGERINGKGIAHSGFPTLTITSEANGSGNGNGALNIYTTGSGNYGIITGAITINGGNVTADTDGSNAVALYAADTDLTINGGTVTATTTGIGAHAIRAFRNLNYNGGNVTATAAKVYAIMTYGNYTLGWTRPADRITIGATGLYPPDGGTVAVAEGKALTDGSGHIYTGTLSADDLAALADETLQPCLVLNETDGVTPLDAFAGQANVPVMFTRPFTSGVASTVCLPFAISADQAAAAGKFYTFAGVNTKGSEWVVTMQEDDPSNLVSGELAANTPYLFMPSASREVTFSGTIGNVADTYTAGTTTSGGWTYQGTYETIEWTTDPRNIYGFASGQAYGNSGDETEAGKFIRVHTGGIRPFRAYLQYSGSVHARALSRSATDGLPETMTVRLIGSNGETTAIGTLDTRTGELDFDADSWYDMNGRRLSGKPSQKGVYINNSRKVIVK